MKSKILSIVFAVFMITILTSLTTNSKTKNDLTELSTDQNDWGPWKNTSCFRHLQYQIKKADYPGKFYIRFKNGYDKSISMGIVVSGNTGSKEDSGRFTVRSGDTSSQYYFVDENSTRIEFNIDKVKFGDTSWGGPYADCDY